MSDEVEQEIRVTSQEIIGCINAYVDEQFKAKSKWWRKLHVAAALELVQKEYGMNIDEMQAMLTYFRRKELPGIEEH